MRSEATRESECGNGEGKAQPVRVRISLLARIYGGGGGGTSAGGDARAVSLASFPQSGAGDC